MKIMKENGATVYAQPRFYFGARTTLELILNARLKDISDCRHARLRETVRLFYVTSRSTIIMFPYDYHLA